MKNKSFSNKPEDLRAKAAAQIEVEKKLLPRLTFIGYVMCVLTVTALTFAIVAPEGPEIGPELIQEASLQKSTAGLSLGDDEDPLELSSREVFNYYVVSAIFALVGASCFLILWKKRKTFALMEQNESKK